MLWNILRTLKFSQLTGYELVKGNIDLNLFLALQF